MIAWEERKQRRFVGVKISWSIATRVRIVALEEGFPLIMIRRWRKENQVVETIDETVKEVLKKT